MHLFEVSYQKLKYIVTMNPKGPKRIDRWSDQLKERVVHACLVDKMSFGNISKMFKIPKTSVQDTVRRQNLTTIHKILQWRR